MSFLSLSIDGVLSMIIDELDALHHISAEAINEAAYWLCYDPGDTSGTTLDLQAIICRLGEEILLAYRDIDYMPVSDYGYRFKERRGIGTIILEKYVIIDDLYCPPSVCY